MKKLNWTANRKDKTVYVNLTAEDIKNLEKNHLWQTTLKITLHNCIFSFWTVIRDDLNNNKY